MRFFPIIPVWIMAIICVIVLVFKRKKTKDYIIQIIIVILLFIINLRPMVKLSNINVENNNLDVLFVIDTTISMLAEDVSDAENRLEAVKKDCGYIIDKLSGAKFSVITFNNESQVMFPYTIDHNLAKNTIEAMKPLNELYSHGSSLNIPKEKMKKMLKNSNDNEKRAKIVFYISDGEITNDEKLKSFEDLKEYISDGAVLGYGTKEGGKMKIEDRLTEGMTYMQDESSYPRQDAISKLDEENLKNIAKDLNIDYINMKKQSNINSKIESIKNGVKRKTGEDVITSYDDVYYFFIIPLIGLLIYEFINLKRRL